MKLTAFILGVLLLVSITAAADGSPWDYVPERGEGIDHSAVIEGPFEDAFEVTATCLICHPDVGAAVIQTTHWTWVPGKLQMAEGGEAVSFGKLNAINNFCISVPSNWSRCSQCHISYGWVDGGFDFDDPAAIDCLICHDSTGTYKKAKLGGGLPEPDVDLTAVAQSVAMPTRANCGACHFQGGGGDNVKHGDLDMTMMDCAPETDVHMGVHDFVCQDCHITTDHEVAGRLAWLGGTESGVACESCHGDSPHHLEMINEHYESVACQTCHVPIYATETPTKLDWDWSTAGLEAAPDEREWNRKKGSFVFGTDVVPDYLWWNGDATPYVPGSAIDPDTATGLNAPVGAFDDAGAKIWPFKIHRGNQPYDTQLGHLLVPQLVGDEGFWKTFDWNQALNLGAGASGIPYSGEFGFTTTEMHWPITHMVQPSDQALVCMDCHGDNGRMPWDALGYSGDPMIYGTR